MGQLVDGIWQPDTLAVKTRGGRFIRSDTQFRDLITADGSSGFKAESGRYHLYISLACPWAHRTLIFRRLKKLENIVGLSIVDPFMADKGWAFSDGLGCIPDPLFGACNMYEIYVQARPKYSGRASVPVLWDRKRATIVNNESSEIIRMMNSEFAALAPETPDYYPKSIRAEIDMVNKRVYTDINNGVYRAGFASTQATYEEALNQLFDALDWVEERLETRRYLCGAALTEADWRLFTTLLRFDCVYVGHFKCNLRRVSDYHSLSNYLRELYQIPGIADLCDFRHIKEHYYTSQVSINPTRIVPGGPQIDLLEPHDRNRL